MEPAVRSARYRESSAFPREGSQGGPGRGAAEGGCSSPRTPTGRPECTEDALDPWPVVERDRDARLDAELLGRLAGGVRDPRRRDGLDNLDGAGFEGGAGRAAPVGIVHLPDDREELVVPTEAGAGFDSVGGVGTPTQTARQMSHSASRSQVASSRPSRAAAPVTAWLTPTPFR